MKSLTAPGQTFPSSLTAIGRAALSSLAIGSIAFAGLVVSPSSAAVAVDTGSTVVSAVVPETGSISGIVRNSSGVGINGAVVSAFVYDIEEWEPAETAIATDVTHDGGKYSISGLSEGTYAIKFSAPTTGKSYVSEWFENGRLPWEASYIEVEAGGATTNINAVLSASGHITGKVTASDGLPIPSSDLTIEACGDDEESGGECGIGRATIDNSGNYTISDLAAGTYTVSVSYSGARNLRDEVYPNARYPWSASSRYFSVAGGATATGKDVVLNAGATVTGTVLANGQPAEGTPVFADQVWDGDLSDTYTLGSAIVNADGNFSIGGLWPDDYAIVARPTDDALAPMWSPQALSSRGASVYSIASLQAVTGIDFDLATAGSLSGSATVQGTGAPAAGLDISIYRFVGATTNRVDFIESVITDADGHYSLTQLAPGDYLVRTGQDYSNYLESYYGALPGEGISSASRVSIDAGVELDLDLEAITPAGYTGRVTSESGAPIGGVEVAVADYEYFGETVYTDENGDFSISGLRTGTYELEITPEGFEPELDSAYVGTTIDGGPVETGQPPVDLGTIELAGTVSYTGTVVGVSGVPIAGAYVLASTVQKDGSLHYVDGVRTNSAGKYSFSSLYPGTFYFQVYKAGYPIQYAGGAVERSMATPIIIEEDGTSSGTQIKIFAGGSISGTITDAVTKRAISGLDVYALRTGLNGKGDINGITSVGRTTQDGRYLIPGLAAGTYEVFVNSFGEWDTSKYASTSAVIYVANRAAVKKNIAVAPLRTISGVVTDVDGLGLEDVRVSAENISTGVIEGDVSREGGAYSISLAPGSYRILFEDERQRVAPAYLGNSASKNTAAIATLGSRSLTNRNVTLGQFSGGVTGSLVGDISDDSEIYYQLERMIDGESVMNISSAEIDSNLPFPIRNLRPGDYKLSLAVWEGDQYYGPEISFTVANSIVDLGEIEITNGEPIVWVDKIKNTGAAPSVVSEPSISIGDTVTADVGEWTVDGKPIESDWFSVNWLRDGKVIPQATAREYVATAGDVGKRLSFEVRTDPFEFESPLFAELGAVVRSSSSEAVQPGAAPVAATNPEITGAGRVGSPLRVSTGTWSTPGISFAVEWKRAGSDSVLARTFTYYPTEADRGHELTATITAKKAGHERGTASAQTGEIAASALTQTTPSTSTVGTDSYSVTRGTWTPAPSSYLYEWRVYETDGTFAEVAGGRSFPRSPDHTGKRVSVVITAIRDGFTPASIEHTVRTGARLTWNDGDITVDGTNAVGRKLTVNLSATSSTPAATSYSYQWLRNGVPISSATRSSYSPSATGTLSVRVTAKRDGYHSSAVETIAVGSTGTASGAITNVSAPQLPNSAKVGETLTASNGTWDVAGASYSYQWLVNGRVIGGAVTRSYTPLAGDVGEEISVTVTARKAGFVTSEAVETNAVTVELGDTLTATSSPVIRVDGATVSTTTNGKTMSASTGVWTSTGVLFTYQWQVNSGSGWVDIEGADRAALRISVATNPAVFAVGNSYRVTVTAEKAGFGTSLPVASKSIRLA